MLDSLTSLELHLHYPPGTIVETSILEDVGAGIYPVFYLKREDCIRVASNATSLIFDKDSFEPNPSFAPPDWRTKSPWQMKLNSIRRRIRRHRMLSGLPVLRRFSLAEAASPTPPCYPSWETIDQSVRKLRPFQVVTPGNNHTTFVPDFSINDTQTIVRLSAGCIQDFIRHIETLFPHHQQVVLAGGRDSQIILAVRKVSHDNWHCFSADPNYPLIEQWLRQNSLKIRSLIRHDNRNEETRHETVEKIICGDLYADPAHMRWLPTLRRLAQKFGGRCIFWAGTMSSLAHFYHSSALHISGVDHLRFFQSHFDRTSSWQGNYHQIFKNFVRCPLLSPYHSREIWEQVYSHYNPEAVTEGMDLRPALGDTLYGSRLAWSDQNPSPSAYAYKYPLEPKQVYIDFIRSRMSGHADSGMNRFLFRNDGPPDQSPHFQM